MKAKIAVCILALATMGLAHDEGKGKPVTITGTVIDTGCYFSHDAIGEKHAATLPAICAKFTSTGGSSKATPSANTTRGSERVDHR